MDHFVLPEIANRIRKYSFLDPSRQKLIKRQESMRLNGKEFIRSSHKVAFRRHAANLPRKSDLIFPTAYVFDHGIREYPVERPGLKRQITPICLNLPDSQAV